MTKITMTQVTYEQAMDAYYEGKYNMAQELMQYPYTVTRGEIEDMTRDERIALRRALDAILDKQGMDERWDSAYSVYCVLGAVEDKEFYDANIDAFRAYEAKMGEPDFDWGFYSDWHKDMFGFRPR